MATPKPKPLSKMTDAEIKASLAVTKNKEAMAKKKLQEKNTAIANRVRSSRGGLRGGGFIGGGGGMNRTNK
jgi:uncharacterized membrane protein